MNEDYYDKNWTFKEKFLKKFLAPLLIGAVLIALESYSIYDSQKYHPWFQFFGYVFFYFGLGSLICLSDKYNIENKKICNI